jgi:hypothetical protein
MLSALCLRLPAGVLPGVFLLIFANVTSRAAERPDSNKNALVGDYAIHGLCVEHFDNKPLAGMAILLFKGEGRTSPPVKIAETSTDSKGRFEFKGLEPPREGERLDALTYGVFAKGGGRPWGVQFTSSSSRKPEEMEIRMAREKATLIGQVTNEKDQPVAGATVFQKYFEQGAVPGILSAKTDRDGFFEMPDLPLWKWQDGDHAYVTIVHPDYPETSAKAEVLPADIRVKLQTGCVVAGSVVDSVTGKPGAGAVLTLEELGSSHQTIVGTDAKGNFRVAVAEGRYAIRVEAKDRVCVAKNDQECLAGETVKLPTMTLIEGGFIAGQVINTATRQRVVMTDDPDSKQPIQIGLYGPSQPRTRVMRSYALATVDEAGQFKIRAAAGENFPYFINTRGDRMMWDTLKQPPVVVKDGETTSYNMTITPEIPPAEKLKAAKKIVAGLSKKPSERTDQILAEFRKLNYTVDETELWCTLMRELVAIGPEAVPRICDELDRTTDDRTLRRLAFALRAIDDARAVPALIRAIPRSLQPSSSDYGLDVKDAGLMAFVQANDLNNGTARYFDLGRPPREIFGALHKLTRQDLQDEELYSICRSDDQRRSILQRQIYTRQAERWAAWWEANWRTLTQDTSYQKVGVSGTDEPLPPAPDLANLKVRLGDGDGMQGEILSPAAQAGRYADHFIDLDTGYEPHWPKEIAKDEAKLDAKRLAEWAAKNGADLMCITYRAADGTETYVLKGFALKAWEISPRELRNLDKLLSDNKWPRGREVGDLLMHYDPIAKQFVPEANAAFLFQTREGNLGLIEITDRVTRTEDLTGSVTLAPEGVGFFKGVRFNWKTINPQK